MNITVKEVWVNDEGYVCITDELYLLGGRVVRGETYLYRPRTRSSGPAIRLSARGTARLVASIGESVDYADWIDEDSHQEWLNHREPSGDWFEDDPVWFDEDSWH